MIRVGILLMFDDNWLGGAQYYRNLIKAVNDIPNREIEFVLFVDLNVDNTKLKEFQHLEIVKTKLLKRFSLSWVIRKLIVKLLRIDLNLISLLQENKIDVLSHSGWLGKHSEIPTIGWIPDFQHMHFPGFFTEKELKNRDKAFFELCDNCSSVIVSSYDALKDLKKFSPEAYLKAVVMQFAVPFQRRSTDIVPLEELKVRYSFNTPFYLLPNQFWAHKNHKIVIESLGLLKQSNKSITILATGNTNDYRQPDHFSSLEKLIEAKNVVDEFKVLGIIPHSDLLSLFHYASAIINPSFFEGWSTVVEEAKVLGKSVILSDIAIHKEQNPEFAIYFDPTNAEELALLLSENVDKKTIVSENDSKIAETNFTAYGLSFQSIVKEVIKSNKFSA